MSLDKRKIRSKSNKLNFSTELTSGVLFLEVILPINILSKHPEIMNLLASLVFINFNLMTNAQSLKTHTRYCACSTALQCHGNFLNNLNRGSHQFLMNLMWKSVCSVVNHE